jgi:hypothetical protein
MVVVVVAVLASALWRGRGWHWLGLRATRPWWPRTKEEGREGKEGLCSGGYGEMARARARLALIGGLLGFVGALGGKLRAAAIIGVTLSDAWRSSVCLLSSRRQGRGMGLGPGCVVAPPRGQGAVLASSRWGLRASVIFDARCGLACRDMT